MKHTFQMLITAFLLLNLPSLGQTVMGKLFDEDRLPLSNATVVLFDKDSSYVSGCITDSMGRFSIPYDKVPFLLEFRHINYNPIKKYFNSPDCGIVVLSKHDKQLQELVVKAKRPVVSIASDGAFNYSAKMLLKSYRPVSAYDLVKTIPAMIETGGMLNLVGSPSLVIVFNGKKNTLTQDQIYSILKSLPAERVADLRLMYQAPPKYQTNGAVLDILLTREIKFQAETHTGYTFQHRHSLNAGLNMVVPMEDMTLDMLYDYSRSATYTGIDLRADHYVVGKHNRVEQDQELKGDYNNHFARIGFSGKLDDKSKISCTYNGSFSPDGRSRMKSVGNIFGSFNHSDQSHYTNNLNLQYDHSSGWDINLDYTNYYSQENGFVRQSFNGNEVSFSNNSSQRVNKINASLDKTFQLNKSLSFTLGTDYTFSKSRDASIYDQQHEGANIKSSLKEHDWSLYGGFSKAWGPRLNASIYFVGDYYKRNNISNWQIYPKGSLTYIKDADNIFQLTLSTEKQYPDYRQMQAVTNYMDPYSIIVGNPELKPSLEYTSQFMYLLKQKYVFQFVAKYTHDWRTQTGYQDPEKLNLIYKWNNWKHHLHLNLIAAIPFTTVNGFSHRLTLIGQYLDIRTNNYYGEQLHRNKLFGLVMLNNSLKLPVKPNISVDLNAYYQSPFIQGTYDLSEIWDIEAAVKYTSPNNKFIVELSGKNLFEKQIPKSTISYKGQYLSNYTGMNQKSFSLKISYRFGGYKEVKHKEIDTSRFGL